MADFERVMAVAILLLAGFFVLVYYEISPYSPQQIGTTKYITYPSIPESEKESSPSLPEEEKNNETKEKEKKSFTKDLAKTFGTGINEGIKHISIAENVFVSFTSGEKIILSEKNITVKNGFGGRKAYENTFYIDWPEIVEKASIEIKVHDTNLYGNLLVFLNDELIYENLTRRGEIVIDLNVSKLKKKNKIMIFATSSGWRLWAPTTYILSFNITIHFFDAKKKELPFIIGDEIKTLKLLRFVWFVEKIEGNGKLIARFNGKEIYRGKESSPMIDLDPEKFEIKRGENVLEFYVEKNTSCYINKVSAILFYHEKKIPTFTFNISEEEYKMLSEKNATFSFTLQKIYDDIISIGLKVIRNDGKEKKILLQGIIREGKRYEIELTKDELSIGKNKITFEVHGDGWIVVKDVKLEIGE